MNDGKGKSASWGRSVLERVWMSARRVMISERGRLTAPQLPQDLPSEAAPHLGQLPSCMVTRSVCGLLVVWFE